jgi:phosphate-selective porin
MNAIWSRSGARVLCGAAILLAATTATADVVTGTVTPAGATVVILDAKGAEVAKLSAGPYQLQLPVGKYKARCTAPKEREQEFLSLSDPVTVNISCG